MATIDPFLQQLAHLAHEQARLTASEREQQEKQNAERDGDDEKATTTAMDESAGGAIVSPLPMPSILPSRGIPYLQQHVQHYQKRIESLLSCLQDVRFGRQSANTQLMQQLHKSAQEMQRDVTSLESEWSTWLLLIDLRKSDESTRQASFDPSLAERYSEELVAGRLVSSPAGHPLVRILHILNWLEELAVMVLRVENNGEVSQRRTLRRMQRSMHPDQAKEQLDPDVESRLLTAGVIPEAGTIIEPADAEEEQRLLEYVWQLIRAGRLSQAIQLCRTYQQHWRAASLQGGERTHDEGMRQPDGSVIRVGNPTRLLWRYTCRQLSQAPGVSAVESSIYGLLGGHLPSALAYSGQYKYDDALYIYLKLLVDRMVDEWITNQGKMNEIVKQLPKDDHSSQILPTLTAVLTSLESPLNNLVSSAVHEVASSNPYVRLQKWLMLDEIDKVEQEMVRTIQRYLQIVEGKTTTMGATPMSGGALVPAEKPGQIINHTYLHFAFHLYLYLHPDCPHAEPLNESGMYILHSYLSYLQHHPSQHSLIAPYLQYMPSDKRIDFYVRFLSSKFVPSLERRQQLLAQLDTICPQDTLEVTRRLVQNIMSEEKGVTTSTAPTISAGASQRLTQQRPLAAGLLPSAPSTVPNLLQPTSSSSLSATANVSASDQSKIMSLDCFDLRSAANHTGMMDASGSHRHDTAHSLSAALAVVQEALSSATALMRQFVLEENYAAGKMLVKHLDENRWESLVRQVIAAAERGQITVSPLILSLEREYLQWKLYIKCLHWYDTWLTHQSTAPLHPPKFNPNHYSTLQQARMEYERFTRKYTTYLTEKETWEKDQADTVGRCVNAYMELFQYDGGWMISEEGSVQRVSELRAVRQLCIPTLVFLLMQMCMQSKQQQLGLALADLVASPLYSLHSCFTPHQLRALLAQCRSAYIATYLNKHNHDEEKQNVHS